LLGPDLLGSDLAESMFKPELMFKRIRILGYLGINYYKNKRLCKSTTQSSPYKMHNPLAVRGSYLSSK
jgi:hypothetical protein